MTINEATSIRLGAQTATAVYLGANKVWPVTPTGSWGPNEGIYASGATPAAAGSDPQTFSVGNRIQILTAGRITGIRHWRDAVSSVTSHSVDLWTDAGALLAHGVTTGDVVGWNTFVITPVNVSAGDVVRVTHGQYGSAAGDSWPYNASAHTSVSPNLVWHQGVFAVGPVDGFPSTTTDGYNYFVDLVYQKKLEWAPTEIAGLHVWLDADQLGLADGAAVSPWPNLGAGADPGIVGTPAPKLKTGTLNGKSVVRFTANEGRVRSAADWGGPIYDWTVIYVCRWWGTNVGRAFSIQYPPSNLLIGMHTSQPDTMYDNGTWLVLGTGWNGWTPGSAPWRLYGGDSKTSVGSRFFINGVQVNGLVSGVGGFSNGWALSGYDASGSSETMDLDVAELLIYDRRLTDPERVQVEDYLRAKWGLA